MLMTNENVRLYWHDKILQKTLMRLIPRGVTPNQVTALRVLLTPFVLYFLWQENWSVVIPLFLFTAFTDVVDGTLARTRKLITMWGTAADPAADKILIGSVMIAFVAREINVSFAGIILFVEAMVVLTATLRRRRTGALISANWAGKIKMILQCTGVMALLLAKAYGLNLFVPFSIGTLSVGIVFAIISIYTYSV